MTDTNNSRYLDIVPESWQMTVFAECFDTWENELRYLMNTYGMYIRPYFAWLHVCNPDSLCVVVLDGRLLNTYQAQHHKKPKIPQFDMHDTNSSHDRGMATEFWYDLSHHSSSSSSSSSSNSDTGYHDLSPDEMSFLRYYSSISCKTTPLYRMIEDNDEESSSYSLPLRWGQYGIIAWSWRAPALPPEASSEDRQLMDMFWGMFTDSLFQMKVNNSLLWMTWHPSGHQREMEGFFTRWRHFQDVFYHARPHKENVYAIIASFLQLYNRKAPFFLATRLKSMPPHNDRTQNIK